MKPPSALAAKGEAVEEWIDLHFFRPAGFRIARALAPTGATPDQVTVLSLVLGLIAGHLFVYPSRRLNALGVVLFVVSDIFDSADGQLARMRGTSTRLGRILDGVSDNLRFINLYVHLLIRVLLAGVGWEAVPLAIAAGFSHSFQSAAVDFIRQVYLYLAAGKGSELDLPETLPPSDDGSLGRRIASWFYRDYVRRQVWLFPATATLVRATGTGATETFRNAYRARMTGLVTQCAWIGQNMRFLLLSVTAVMGWPTGFFWLTVGPLNLVLLTIVAVQELRVRAMLRAAVAATPSHVQVA